MELSDQESGESKTYKFWACGDSTDFAKAKGSAETYAMKYMLSKFFLIRVVDMDDPDAKDKSDKKEVNKKERIATSDPKEEKQTKSITTIKEKIILKDNWWHCKKCDDKIIQNYSGIKLNDVTKLI